MAESDTDLNVNSRQCCNVIIANFIFDNYTKKLRLLYKKFCLLIQASQKLYTLKNIRMM